MNPAPEGPTKLGWRIRLFLARVVAYLFDFLLTLAIVLASQAVIWRAGWNPLPPRPEPDDLHAWVTVTVTLPVFLYFVASTWLHGATFGQSLLKLRVSPVEREGRLALGRTLVRYVIVLAPFELNHIAWFYQLWWVLGAVYLLAGLLLASMVLQPEGRGFHDLVAGSRVIRRHAAQT
jgi:uncharacterized RDD family membrane protein YckC